MVQDKLPVPYIQSFENCGTPGTPDLYILSPYGPRWLELKVIESYRQGIGLEPEQPRWHTNYRLSGGTSMILVLVAGIRLILTNPQADVRLMRQRRLCEFDSSWIKAEFPADDAELWLSVAKQL